MVGEKIIFEVDGRRKNNINPDKFDKLIRSIKIAVDNDGTLDKAPKSH